MKKIVSVCLMLTMLAALLMSAFTVSAANAEPANPYAFLDFEDGKDPFSPPGDRYTQAATTVQSINGNSAGIIFPLKNPENWNHVGTPFLFTRGKTYVISYDVTVLEQAGISEMKDVKLIPFVNCSAYFSESANPNFTSTKRDLKMAAGSSTTVKPGVWTHTVGTLYIPAENEVWWTHDSLGFYEDQSSMNEASSTFAIDNLVIMEKTDFETLYPNGVPARTDDPSVGYDKIVADFDHSRYPVFRSSNAQTGRLSVTLRGDSVLTWDRRETELTKETCLNIPFRLEANKTYRVSFDVATNAGGVGTQFELAASDKILATDAAAALQKFADQTSATTVTLADTSWIHVDMILTPATNAKFFTLLLSDASVSKICKIYFDNFALAEVDRFPAEMPLRTAGIDNVMRETFDTDIGAFSSAFWATNNKLSVAEVERNGIAEKVLNWEATTPGPSWNKLNVSYCFKPNTKYVISFDVMLYGVQTEDGISADEIGPTSLRILTIDQDWTKYEAGANHGDVAVQPGVWTHISVGIDVSSTKSQNYMGLFELPANETNGCFYIDNFVIAEKRDCTIDGHIGGVWVVTTSSTCQVAGEMVQNCAVCGEAMGSKEAPLAPHTPVGEWIVDEAASCTEEGTQHKNCSACGQEAVRETVAKLAHTPTGEWIVDEAASCTKEGTQHKNCSVCGQEAIRESIAKIAHTPGEWVEDPAAGCETAGAQYKKCTVCQQEVVREAIQATGHKPGEWVIDKAAAVGVEGSRHKDCTVCGEKVEEETIDALPAPATDAPKTDGPATNADTASTGNKEGGCNSALGMSGLAMLGLLSMAGVMLGKKK